MSPYVRTTAAITLAAFLVTAVIGCSELPTTSAPASLSTAINVTQARRHLAPSDFDVALRQPGTTLLDVRTPAEYASGHLSGAVNIDVEATDFGARTGGLDKAATYAIYCHSGARSAAAVDAMTASGFSSLYDLSGGIAAWVQSGRPTVTAP